MKKKLITGLGLVLLIFTIGAMVVIKNLDTIVMNQRLINEQDIIIGKYNEMLFQIKGAQAELYRHQAGYSRNIDDLVSYIEAFDENMDFLSRQYSGHLNDVACMQCHAKIEERLTSLQGIFSEMKTLIKDYKTSYKRVKAKKRQIVWQRKSIIGHLVKSIFYKSTLKEHF
ncbi:hypothetical protein A45J_0547 [hot springs metagenome]|uniref:Chemotaxis methyl-accepting receptor HlyB-like 4HB MCP domain-containing protein n=1 Tax=hot springs metagenome TaxID=433727 RepID=A0A5J4L3K1_9ZZZZ